jgi:hypothetical protein
MFLVINVRDRDRDNRAGGRLSHQYWFVFIIPIIPGPVNLTPVLVLGGHQFLTAPPLLETRMPGMMKTNQYW